VVNQQFQFAVHILILLARTGELLDSKAIAISLNTNPVVVRRVLLALRRASLIETCTGRCGGARLVKTANRISLLDVYDAIQLQPAIRVHRRRVARPCSVSCNMRRVLTSVSNRAEAGIRRELRHILLSKVANEIACGG
jgi:Rrf2 family protein